MSPGYQVEGKRKKTQAYLPIYPSLLGCWGHYQIPLHSGLVKLSRKMAEAGFRFCSLSSQSGRVSATISSPGHVLVSGGVRGASEEPRPAIAKYSSSPLVCQSNQPSLFGSRQSSFAHPLGALAGGRAELGYCWRECIHSQVSRGLSLDAGARAKHCCRGVRHSVLSRSV